MHFFRYVIPAFLAMAALASFTYPSPGNELVASSSINRAEADPVNLKMAELAGEAKKFARERGFNESICFLVDMSIPSGKNRFFIYNLKEDSVSASALVSHGVCYGGEPNAKFSNVVGSGCSSLGKYKIGNPYVGQWGYSYKLHGLESTNSNAFERTVVLHSHQSIPDIETGEEIAVSLGCPMVSPNFLLSLKKIINNSKKPILLWIYQ